jgi:hypothetical protein
MAVNWRDIKGNVLSAAEGQLAVDGGRIDLSGLNLPGGLYDVLVQCRRTSTVLRFRFAVRVWPNSGIMIEPLDGLIVKGKELELTGYRLTAAGKKKIIKEACAWSLKGSDMTRAKFRETAGSMLTGSNPVHLVGLQPSAHKFDVYVELTDYTDGDNAIAHGAYTVVEVKFNENMIIVPWGMWYDKLLYASVKPADVQDEVGLRYPLTGFHVYTVGPKDGRWDFSVASLPTGAMDSNITAFVTGDKVAANLELRKPPKPE